MHRNELQRKEQRLIQRSLLFKLMELPYGVR